MAGDRAADAGGALAPLFRVGATLSLGDADLLERFLGGDPVAFEAIVRRHGPMVLGVCRRVLDDPNDADDAFQATFALLVTRARAIHRRESLASWLHGVARRLATGVRVGGRRRRARERAWAATAPRWIAPVPSDDWCAILDVELARLPERLRAPLILCDLEGQTHEAAALTLRCPVGTVKSRLHRGRDRLRSRLGRRGLNATVGSTGILVDLKRGAPITEAAIRQVLRGVATVAASGRAAPLRAVIGRPRSLPTMMFGSFCRVKAIGLLAVGLFATGAWALRPMPRFPEAPALADPPVSAHGDRPPLVAEAAPVEKYRLDNGLTVILRPIAGAEDAALVVLYDLGTDHDPAGQSGLGHLAEHLYLTAAAGPTPTRTTDELMRRYPKGMNGQTGERYTVLATVFPAADLVAELTDAAARMGALRVEDRDLDQERPRLLEEVSNMFANFPPLAAQNNARELVRPTPNAGRRGGVPESIGPILASEIQRRLERFYRPRNATLALAGKLDPVAARATISARFGLIPAGEPAPSASDPGPAALGTVREVATPAGHPGAPPMVALAYLAPQPSDPLYAPFLVLATRLWAASSTLADPSEGFGFPVYFTPLDDGAVIAFTSRARPGESTAATIQRIEAFVAQTVDPALGFFEAGRAADQIGALFNTRPLPDSALGANPYGVAFALARRQQLGIEPKRFDAALRAVDSAALRRAAERFLTRDRHAAAVIRR